MPTDEKLQRGLIITDDISPAPILDFDLYRNAITKIIRESYPKFSIGIYGDWGMGKTTLMQSIFDQLTTENDKENPIILVWFNAWRYEREEHFSIIPLLKTIEFSIPEKKYESLKKSFKDAGMFGLKISKDIFSSMVGNYLGKEISDLLNKGISELTETVVPNLERFNDLEKSTIYFEGQRKIETEINRLREENPNFRIVVFVDDLDRCSPEKVIEVFESIKIFLGMDGFIYVLGLSQNKISELIRKKYKFEKEEDGDHYIKKIIQIPITLSEWNDDDVKKLLKEFLKKDIIHKNYHNIINENLDLISIAVEDNPREVKRFLNNFIVAYEIFSKGKIIEPKELLVIQAIQVRWNSFYHIIVKFGANFCDELKKYIEFSNEERIKKIESDEKDQNFDYNFKLMLRNYRSNTDLWNFIKEQANVLFNIKEWSLYRRAVESTKDISNISKTKSKVNYRELDMLSDFNFILKRVIDIVKQSKNIQPNDKVQVEFKIDFLFPFLFKLKESIQYSDLEQIIGRVNELHRHFSELEMLITHISSETDKQEYTILNDLFINLRNILETLIDYFYKEIDGN